MKIDYIKVDVTVKMRDGKTHKNPITIKLDEIANHLSLSDEFDMALEKQKTFAKEYDKEIWDDKNRSLDEF